MKIIQISEDKRVKKTEKEKKKEMDACENEALKMLVGDYKFVPSNEPIYIVEMTSKEFQLISFYLELDNINYHDEFNHFIEDIILITLICSCLLISIFKIVIFKSNFK